MNITLSADEKLISGARAYAKRHSTSLNNLIRDYLRSLINEQTVEESVTEFTELALNEGGATPVGFRFDRKNIYDRYEHSSDNQK